MAKLYWRFGTMGSSKTANALMTKFNYEEKGYKVLLLKPSIDDRDGNNIIKSRIGLQAEARLINKNDDIYVIFTYIFCDINPLPDVIIIDEAQFLTNIQIEDLKRIAMIFNIPVFCYGLRTDFKSNLFEGSKRLFEIADSISEIKSICHCGNKAIINARVKDNKIVYDGDLIDIGGNDKYIGLCYKCWIEEKLK
jgi:thymidine kinase